MPVHMLMMFASLFHLSTWIRDLRHYQKLLFLATSSLLSSGGVSLISSCVIVSSVLSFTGASEIVFDSSFSFDPLTDKSTTTVSSISDGFFSIQRTCGSSIGCVPL